jgi:U3 small nucleolar RNA-associated protein 23
MRVLRAKAVRKILRFYRLLFGIVAPYHVILDGNFIFAALKHKVDISHRLTGLLQDSVKLYVLASCLEELKKVGDKARPTLEFAMRCCECVQDRNDSSDSCTASDALLAFAQNQAQSALDNPKARRYFIATQDNALRSSIGSIPGIPAIYFNQVTLVLEGPSEASRNFTARVERRKLDLTAIEIEELSGRKRQRENNDDEESQSIVKTQQERKKHKATAPNPLSHHPPNPNSKSQEKRKKQKYRA